jgi:glycosyltransferase involved in cell wall biosynthesis
MKILHVIPGLQNSSGPTQVVRYLAAYATELGHDVTIAYVSNRKPDIDLSVFDPRVKIKDFPATLLHHWAFSPALWSFLKNQVSSFEIIHLHSLWLFPNIAVRYWASRQGVPYVIRPIGSLQPWAFQYKNWKKTWYFKLVEKQNIEGAACIHVAAEDESNNIERFRFSTPVSVIPNGIETSIFDLAQMPANDNARNQLGLPNNAFIILFLSRIHPVKNLEFLVDVAADVVAKYSQAYFAIAGPDDSSYANAIKQKIMDLGLEKNSCFLGEVEGERKLQCFQAANVFMLPSLSENFAIVVAEAMAAGLPVVISRETPWASVVDKQAGFWLPLNKRAFVEAIAKLIEDERLRLEMGSQATALAKRFDWAVIAKKVTDLYIKINGQIQVEG